MDIRTYLQTENLSQQDFASKLGVTQGMVGHWLHRRNRITAERAAQIESATGGAVTRVDLRPDIFAGQTEAA